MQLQVVSNDGTEAAVVTVQLVNTITLAAQPSWSATPTISFVIEVIDPCTVTTFQDVTVTTINMVLGAVETQTFTEAAVQTEVDNGGYRLCGDRVYTIVDSSDAPVSWMPITGSNPTWTITASPIDENLITSGPTHSYSLEIKFADARYPNVIKKMPLSVTINEATCDCDRLTWDTPAQVTDTIQVADSQKDVTIPTATMNAASKLPTPEIRKCFAAGAGNCAFTTTYAPTLPASGFIVQDG